LKLAGEQEGVSESGSDLVEGGHADNGVDGVSGNLSQDAELLLDGQLGCNKGTGDPLNGEEGEEALLIFGGGDEGSSGGGGQGGWGDG
jgi:hypothetical protein